MSEIPTKRIPYPEKKEKMKPFPVLVGIPTPSIDHKLSSGLTAFLSAASARHIALPWMPDSRIAECGRNAIIEDFLTNPDFKDFKYLLFLDHDCFPVDPYTIEKMIQLDKDVVAGITPIMYKRPRAKVPVLNWNVQKEPGRNLNLNEMPQELFKANKVGGTCILVKRKVLEAMTPPYQMATFDEKHIHFQTSEDYYFCDKIRACGFDIWVDPSILCNHFHHANLLEFAIMYSQIKNMNTEPTEEEKKVMETMGKIEEMANG